MSFFIFKRSLPAFGLSVDFSSIFFCWLARLLRTPMYFPRMAAGPPPNRPSVGTGVYNCFFIISSLGTSFFFSTLLELIDMLSSSKAFTDVSFRLFYLLSSQNTSSNRFVLRNFINWIFIWKSLILFLFWTWCFFFSFL